METIVIGKGNIVQTAGARAVDPRLQEFSRIRLNAMSLWMGMIIAEKFHGGSAAPRAMLKLLASPTFITSSSPRDESVRRRTRDRSIHLFHLRLGQKFLPDVKLGIFRKKNVGGKDSAWCQIAGRDVFLVFDVLPRIDENCPWLVFNGVVLRPFGQDGVGGIEQLNLDALISREIEWDHAVAHVGHGHFDFHLSNLREPHWLG